MSQILQKNKNYIEEVFNKVYDKYDLMNDVMSLGAHRKWKKNLIKLMNPTNKQSLIDVGCGTGDIAKLYSKATNYKSNILCVDPNKKMIEKGKNRLKNFSNIQWKECFGEKLKVQDEKFDFYTISFGLRNTSSVEKTISEAYRVLKKGGRFFCLEFSKIRNQNLNFIYSQYSKLLPKIGELVVGDRKPYEYLVKSIDQFLNQDELKKIMEDNKFINCDYIDLNGGVVAIHSGWKI